MYAPLYPGYFIRKDYVEPLGISVEKLAMDLGIETKTLDGILNRKMNVTDELANRLANHFGTSKGYWAELQRNFDLQMEQLRKPNSLFAVQSLKRHLENGGDPDSIPWLMKVK